MATRKIREIGDEVLTKPCKEVTKMTLRTKMLINDMFDTMLAIPPPLTYSRLHRYCATTLTGIKNGYCPLARVFPSTTSLACNRLRVPSFPRSDIPIIRYL